MSCRYISANICAKIFLKYISRIFLKYISKIFLKYISANLSHELPKYRQHVTCSTRDSNILDHCYTIIKEAFHSVPRAALGLADYCFVHLIPTYRHKLKAAKPVIRTVKRWTNEAEKDLKACFDLTDCIVFEAAATDLDELTEPVNSYISLCEDLCIPTRTLFSFNNDKPWFTAKLKQSQAKEDAYRSVVKILYNQARNRLTKEIRVAKKNYSEKLKKDLSANDPASVWTGLRNITKYKTPDYPHSLGRINNWLMISMSFTADLKRPDWHPVPALICTSHIHPIHHGGFAVGQQPQSLPPPPLSLCLKSV